MNQIMKVYVLLAIAFYVPSLALSNEIEPIATDRPDFVESSQTVGFKRIQLETSIQLERPALGQDQKITSTPTLLRLGISPELELRVETDGRMRSETNNTSHSGAADTAIGMKWHMNDQREGTILPSVGWLVHADFDSGSAEFRGTDIRPSLRGVAEWELPYEMSFGIMPGVIHDKDENRNRFAGIIAAAVMGKSWTNTFRTFVEYAAQQLASQSHGGNILTFDAGAAYLIGPRMQVDTAASWGLNSNSPDFSWTLGLSLKI